jgi:hypothetical protein
MAEIDGKTPVEKVAPEAGEESPVPPEEKPLDQVEEKAPAKAGESVPIEAMDEELGGESPDGGEATGPTLNTILFPGT